MQVTYRDEQGYEGVKQAFEAIRQAHTTVYVDNKSLADLGSVVRSWQTLETIH